MKSVAEKNKEFNQQLFDYGVLILIIKNICDSSNIFGGRPEIVDSIFILSFLGLLVWKMAKQVYTKWQVCLLVPLMILCVISCVKMSFFYLIFTIFSIVGIQDVDLECTMKKSSKLKIYILLIHIIVYFACMVVAPSLVTYSYRTVGEPRYTFFLGHANTAGMYILWAIIEFWYAFYNKISVIQIWLLWSLILITYVFTDSNTGMIVGTIVALMLTVVKCSKSQEHRIIKFFAKYLFAIMSMLFILTTVVYTKLSGGLLIAYKIFDKMLTGRLMYGACAYDLKGFSIIGKQLIFPRKFYWHEKWMDTMVFDNGYIWLFVSYGLVFMILIALGFMLINRRITTLDAIMVVAYCLYGVMENYILNSVLCFPILLIGKYIYEDKRNVPKRIKYINRRKMLSNRRKEIV